MELQVKIIGEAGQARKVSAFVDGQEMPTFGLEITRMLCGTSCYNTLEGGGRFMRESGALAEVWWSDGFSNLFTAADILDEIVRRADAVNSAFEEKYPAIEDYAETAYMWPTRAKTGRRR